MRAVLLQPGSLGARTGGTLYNRRLLRALAAAGWRFEVVELAANWPLCSEAELAAIEAALDRLPPGRTLLVDGLVWTGMGPLLPELARRHPTLVLVHSPLFREAGAAAGERARLIALESAALAHAHTRIVTGGPAQRDLRELLGHESVRIEPGVEPAPAAPAPDPGALLCAATVTPRKGHLRLLDALATLPEHRWTLRGAGSLTRAPDHAERCQRRAEELGLAARVEWLGELDGPRLARSLHASGTFVQSSSYEAYGMAIMEAVACGLPVVSTPAGVLEGPCGEAALVCPSLAPAELARCLRELLDHEWGRLRAAALRIRRELPTWDAVAHRFASLLAEAAA